MSKGCPWAIRPCGQIMGNQSAHPCSEGPRHTLQWGVAWALPPLLVHIYIVWPMAPMPCSENSPRSACSSNSLRPPRCVSTGQVVVSLAERANELNERERERAPPI